MGKSYTKDELVGAALMRFEKLGVDTVESLKIIFNKFYDAEGREKFRKYASVTPLAVQKYLDRE